MTCWFSEFMIKVQNINYCMCGGRKHKETHKVMRNVNIGSRSLEVSIMRNCLHSHMKDLLPCKISRFEIVR